MQAKTPEKMSFILFLTNKFQMFASDSWSADRISWRLQLFSLVLDRTESETNAPHCQWLAVKGIQFFQTDETGRVPGKTGRVVSRKQLIGTALITELKRK